MSLARAVGSSPRRLEAEWSADELDELVAQLTEEHERESAAKREADLRAQLRGMV